MKLAIAFAISAVASLTFSAPAKADVTVSTLAGSGITGFADGPALQASFMLPMGVAYDRSGNLYVADAAAQRIRVIQKDGTVRTIAGSGEPDKSGTWVPGGYTDGPAARARFNRPADVAVAADGRIFVADSYNHCIREISPNGVVSTFAGSPARDKPVLGTRDVASFVIPSALAFDGDGNLLVVDAGTLRKVDPMGTVTAVPLPGGSIPISGFALADTAAGTALFIPTLDGMYVQGANGQSKRYLATFFTSQCAGKTSFGWWDCSDTAARIREHRDIGMPWGAVALNDHTVVYSDWKTGSIRLLDVRFDTQRLLAGYAGGDESGRGGGHADGPGSDATFNLPLGLALGADGQIAIADAGSRRVRIMRGVDVSEPLAPADAIPPAAAATRTIIYAGDFTAWQGTAWADSIAGRLQSTLDPNTRVLPLVLDSMWADLDALSGLRGRHVDVFVLQLNMLDVAALAGVTPYQAAASPQSWRPKFEAALGRLRTAVAASGGRLAIVLAPLPREIGPAAGLWTRALDVSHDTVGGTSNVLNALTAFKLPVVDATPLFVQANAQSIPPPLFATGGYEFAAGGREAMAQAARNAVKGLLP